MTETPDSPILTVEGDLVTLGPISRDVVPIAARWMNDPGAQQRLGFQIPRPFTLQDEEKWFDTEVVGAEKVIFLVRERATGAPIGTTSLFDHRLKDRSCEFGILIGEKPARGRGLGTEATRLTLDYAFTVLEMHSVHLRTAGYNLMGQRAYARAGFREVGRYRETLWQFGHWWDMVFMDCLDSEFESPVLRHQIGPDQHS
ncbi:MAG TPA: GNAT family protein [Thermomicrobiales bacterium]|nr:GNAT family protein [Thermomicrobiales bacterium]